MPSFGNSLGFYWSGGLRISWVSFWAGNEKDECLCGTNVGGGDIFIEMMSSS